TIRCRRSMGSATCSSTSTSGWPGFLGARRALGDVLCLGERSELRAEARTRTPGGQHGPRRASRPPEPLVIRVKGAAVLVGSPSLQAEDVLSARAGVAEVRWALLGASPRKAVRGALQGLLEEGAVLRACRVRRAKLKPGRKLTVHYDAWVRSGGADLERSIVAVWDRGDGGIHLDPQARALEAEAVAEGLATPFRGLFARLPGWNVLVLVSPLDPRFPQLIRLSNPRYVAAMLAGPLSQASAAGYRIRTIRYRPGARHVLRYEPSPALASTRAVFAKLSRR